MGCSSSSSSAVQEIKKNGATFFDSGKLGSIEVKNRLVMAAMTRCRGDPTTGIPNDLMADYYAQRADFGLILTECSQISPLSNAFPGSGGIYSKEQVEGWKKVTQKVHEKGGKIVLQIWHSGRAVLKEFIGGSDPLAPSAIAIRTPHAYTKGPHPVPKEMTKEDIKTVIEEFRQGAVNAKEAGFDGIQLHGANGYLVDQFLKDGTNHRTDEYGGSIENRARFLFEALDALISVFGADKVGIKLSPTGRYNDMYDSNPLESLKYVLKELEKRKIAFVEVKRHNKTEVSSSENGKDEHGQTLPEVQIPNFFDQIRPLYSGTLILNDGVDQKLGEELLATGKADFISFAKLAIANPDLPNRFKNGWEVAMPDFSLLFSGGEKGYNDYHRHEAKKQE
ncbi:FAD/FMN-binding family oxidoreductase (macronuclear) [Tetrahymena thermophila SB210]|uniref:FAD/FMN-binding family oxidoreductase n=1 Tax=Tetrahymena thermophila (strain SB210) TaxID=312017 RepID=Q22W51_TETTS|nr:FAD/FMN-binding family oxidoreductase [Tetrahymena thermophila SB210]EAR89566.2 FAD/FMN-binding family oxidoreductase [Tetrahymena thermophila SB210]|eukprot:XP_001009811.2 FAD/FMN-binding family oxidoreductase [Tetrahymena thermophila SB210]